MTVTRDRHGHGRTDTPGPTAAETLLGGLGPCHVSATAEARPGGGEPERRRLGPRPPPSAEAGGKLELEPSAARVMVTVTVSDTAGRVRPGPAVSLSGRSGPTGRAGGRAPGRAGGPVPGHRGMRAAARAGPHRRAAANAAAARPGGAGPGDRQTRPRAWPTLNARVDLPLVVTLPLPADCLPYYQSLPSHKPESRAGPLAVGCRRSDPAGRGGPAAGTVRPGVTA